MRNNVIYNGREGFVHHNPANGDFNVIGNYYKDGPSANLAPLWFDPENGPTVPTRYYVWNNWVDHPGTFTGRVDNPYTTPGFAAAYSFACCGIQSTQFNTWGEFNFTSYPGYVAIPTDAPAAAYEAVLNRAGSWPQDVVNRWAVDETRTRIGSWGNRRPADWLQGLTPGTPPADSDNDGMPNGWETARGLNPANGADAVTVRPSGYTAIEEYINEMAQILEGAVFSDGFEIGTVERWTGSRP